MIVAVVTMEFLVIVGVVDDSGIVLDIGGRGKSRRW